MHNMPDKITEEETVTLDELCEQLWNAHFSPSNNGRYVFKEDELVALADRLGLRPFAPPAILATFLAINSHKSIPKSDPYNRVKTTKDRVHRMLAKCCQTPAGKRFFEKVKLTPSAPTTQAPAPTALVATAAPTSTAVATASVSSVPPPPPAAAPIADARSILSRRVRQITHCEACKVSYARVEEREAFANNKCRPSEVRGCMELNHSVGMNELVAMVKPAYPRGYVDKNIYPDMMKIMKELFESTDDQGHTTGLTPLGDPYSPYPYQVSLRKPGLSTLCKVKGVKRCRFPGVKIVDDDASQLALTNSDAGHTASAAGSSEQHQAKRSIDQVSGETPVAKVAKRAVNRWGDDLKAMLDDARAANHLDRLSTAEYTPASLAKAINNRGAEQVHQNLCNLPLPEGAADKIISIFLDDDDE